MNELKRKNDFLYICDCHYGAQPVSRIDDYNASILQKIGKVLAIAKIRKIPLLIGGDLFDTPRISMVRLMDIFSLFDRYRDVDIIINRGNHSHDGHPESSPLSILAYAFKNITLSDGNPFVNIDNMHIVMAPNEMNPLLYDDFVDESFDYNILMTHHLIVEKSIPYDHILISDFKTKFDYVFLADYHPQQGIVLNGDTQFISPGSLARRKNTPSDINREPCYVYFKNGKIYFIKVPDVVKNVFVEKVQDETQETNIIDNVKKMIELVDTDICNVSIGEALTIFGEKVDTDKDIIKFIQERMEHM